MPRACPVEHSRSPLLSSTPLHGDATGLSRGVSRSRYSRRLRFMEMPRACPAESHVLRYSRRLRFMEMPRACPVESHVLATLVDSASWRCHGLVPWSLTFAATARCYCSLLRFASSLANLSIYFRICGFDKSPYEPMYALFTIVDRHALESALAA